MKKEEEKFDELLRAMMPENNVEAPQNKNFTNQVMKSVVAHQSLKDSKGSSGRQFLYAILGLLACLSIVATVIILWQTGNLTEISILAADLLRPVLQALPFKVAPWMLVVGVLYFFLSRALFTLYFLNRQHRKRQISW